MPPTSHDASRPQLRRRLGLPDAVLLGVGSMLGAGVLAVPAPAAAAAGSGLLLGLALAAAACLGALLGLVAGVSRTAWAMAGEGDLPGRLAVLHPRHRVPHVAERAVGAAVVVLVLVADLPTLIGFSSFGVLLYDAVANAAALTQSGPERRWPRALQVVGLVGCVTLALSLPGATVLAGAGVLAVGLAGRVLARRRRLRPR